MIYGPYDAIVVSVHDGDTLELDVHLERRRLRRRVPVDVGFNVQLRRDGVWLARQAVRTFGDNAPELSTLAGQKALVYLRELLPVGTRVKLISHGFDKFGGRIDGTVTLPDGRDLVTVMIAAGHAAAWDGKGRKPLPA